MIAVYQIVNAHAPAIHWWLATDPRFGPQLYQLEDPHHTQTIPTQLDKNFVGGIVTEWRHPTDMDQTVYELHQESLREMENLVSGSSTDHIRVDCTSKYFNAMEGHWGNGEDPIVGYQYPVWSNYFGNTNSAAVPLSDKLIFCESSMAENCFFYVSQYAFVTLTLEEIDEHTTVWWEDHKLMGGKILDSWKDVWYNKYHQQVINDFNEGELQYMWQLNFAHWDLHTNLKNGIDNFELDYSFDRLFKSKLDPHGILPQTETLDHIKDKVDYLSVDINWFDNIDVILDYLQITKSDALVQSAKDYKLRFEYCREEYNKLFSKYLIK